MDPRSERNLAGVHPDLQKVIRLAWGRMPDAFGFTVIEGIRSEEKQARLVKAGASQTLKSRHLTGHAVDLAALVGSEIRWDWPLYAMIAQVVKHCAHELGVIIEWGGDWKSLKDGPHFQLPWKEYPLTEEA